MKHLTLLRHAKSSWKDPLAADFDRRLNGRGRSDAPEMGKRLRKVGFRPDVIITSPARRARSTARIVAGELGIPKEEIVSEAAIYEADVTDLLRIVRMLSDRVGHAMLVGHNPGFTDFLNFLTGGGTESIPTCGIATVDLDTNDWTSVKRGAGGIAFFDFPKNREAPV